MGLGNQVMNMVTLNKIILITQLMYLEPDLLRPMIVQVRYHHWDVAASLHEDPF